LTDAYNRCVAENPAGCEIWGAIYYPRCHDGFFNVGCCICESYCPDGFRDDGLFCAKPPPYGRGVGYPWKFGDKPFSLDAAKKRCLADNPAGCEIWGAIYYPICKPNFHNVACCICSPNCPNGWTDIGVSCTKPTYGRGVGYPFEFGDCKTGHNHTLPIIITDECDTILDYLLEDLVDLVKNIKDFQKIIELLPRIAAYAAQYSDKCFTKKWKSWKINNIKN